VVETRNSQLPLTARQDGRIGGRRPRLSPQQQTERIALIRRGKDEFTRYQRFGLAHRYKKVTDAAFTAGAAITFGNF
jgi:hypothetical protein